MHKNALTIWRFNISITIKMCLYIQFRDAVLQRRQSAADKKFLSRKSCYEYHFVTMTNAQARRPSRCPPPQLSECSKMCHPCRKMMQCSISRCLWSRRRPPGTPPAHCSQWRMTSSSSSSKLDESRWDTHRLQWGARPVLTNVKRLRVSQQKNISNCQTLILTILVSILFVFWFRTYERPNCP